MGINHSWGYLDMNPTIEHSNKMGIWSPIRMMVHHYTESYFKARCKFDHIFIYRGLCHLGVSWNRAESSTCGWDFPWNKPSSYGGTKIYDTPQSSSTYSWDLKHEINHPAIAASHLSGNPQLEVCREGHLEYRKDWKKNYCHKILQASHWWKSRCPKSPSFTIIHHH